MASRTQIIAESMTWLGTPYHNQACLKGIGVDCAMFLVGIARACALLPATYQVPVYSPQWHLYNNEEVLLQTLNALGCAPVPKDGMRPGDILVFQFGRVSSHCAILVSAPPPYIVQASKSDGRVVHHRLDATLLARLRHVFAFPGGGA